MKLLMLFILNAHANIIGIYDDRNPVSDHSHDIQELARSVPALIQHSRIHKLDDKYSSLSGYKMIEDFNMCKDERFSDEALIANCSSSLISDDLVLTAAHCLNETEYACSTYSVVFDYNDTKIKNNDIYKCKEIKFYDFDLRNAGIDLAVIKLDRKVKDRKPVQLNLDLNVGDNLFMIGYPFGIFQKITSNGIVKEIDTKNFSFKSNLDSFSVNSGGPIFNSNNEQVGVLVRGTGNNLEHDEINNCYRWGRDSKGDGFSDANLLDSIINFAK